MIDLHPETHESFERLADWMELQTLKRAPSALAFSEVDALWQGAFLEDSDTWAEDDESQELASVVVGQAWAELRRRARTFAHYPYKVNKTTVRMRKSSWRDTPAHTFLTICEVGQFYDCVDTASSPGAELPDLFELVVEAAQKELFGGVSQWFPAAGSEGWSPRIRERLTELANRFGRSVGDPTDVTNDDCDCGLDVATRLRILDEDPGTLIVLTQCATGKNWKTKTGEPSPDFWRETIRWRSPVVKALALPWRLSDGCSSVPRGVTSRADALARYSKLFNGAIVLDGPRLLAGHPDGALDPSIVAPLQSWCEQRLKEFPSS